MSFYACASFYGACGMTDLGFWLGLHCDPYILADFARSYIVEIQQAEDHIVNNMEESLRRSYIVNEPNQVQSHRRTRLHTLPRWT